MQSISGPITGRLAAAAIPLALLGASAIGCGGESGGSAGSAIAITATVAPACPGPATTLPECGPKPYAGELRVTNTDTGEAVEATTDGDGHAEVSVAPGSYVIASPTPGPPSLAPVNVEVTAGQTSDVTVTLDSGLR